jgi:hypothetical protein
VADAANGVLLRGDAGFFLEGVGRLGHQRAVASAGVGVAHAEEEIGSNRASEGQAHTEQRLPGNFFSFDRGGLQGVGLLKSWLLLPNGRRRGRGCELW